MKVRTDLRLTLELTAEEAKWLHELMQNPLSEDCNPDYEESYDRQMREAFYEATAIEDWRHG